MKHFCNLRQLISLTVFQVIFFVSFGYTQPSSDSFGRNGVEEKPEFLDDREGRLWDGKPGLRLGNKFEDLLKNTLRLDRQENSELIDTFSRITYRSSLLSRLALDIWHQEFKADVNALTVELQRPGELVKEQHSGVYYKKLARIEKFYKEQVLLLLTEDAEKSEFYIRAFYSPQMKLRYFAVALEVLASPDLFHSRTTPEEFMAESAKKHQLDVKLLKEYVYCLNEKLRGDGSRQYALSSNYLVTIDDVLFEQMKFLNRDYYRNGFLPEDTFVQIVDSLFRLQIRKGAPLYNQIVDSLIHSYDQKYQHTDDEISIKIAFLKAKGFKDKLNNMFLDLELVAKIMGSYNGTKNISWDIGESVWLVLAGTSIKGKFQHFPMSFTSMFVMHAELLRAKASKDVQSVVLSGWTERMIGYTKSYLINIIGLKQQAGVYKSMMPIENVPLHNALTDIAQYDRQVRNLLFKIYSKELFKQEAVAAFDQNYYDKLLYSVSPYSFSRLKPGLFRKGGANVYLFDFVPSKCGLLFAI